MKSFVLSEVKNWSSTTNPKVESDLLMFEASFKRSPSAPELFCLHITHHPRSVARIGDLKSITRIFAVALKYKILRNKTSKVTCGTYLSEPARSTRLRWENRWCFIPWDSHCKVDSSVRRLNALIHMHTFRHKYMLLQQYLWKWRQECFAFYYT